MKPWLRSNWIGLVAVAVLLPATVGITFANEWNAYFGERPSAPVDVASGDTAVFAGSGWAVQGSERIPASSPEGEEIGLPAGSALVVVTLRVDPGEQGGEGESPRCIVRLEELDGGSARRSWGDAASEPISFAGTEGTEPICTASNVDPYLVETAFVVPSGVGDDLALSVAVAGELPEFLRLRL